MTWKEYLKSIGMADDKIAAFETTFGPDLAVKAFEGPLQRLAEAEAKATAAEESRKEFEEFYNTKALPEMGKVYQDAINVRTQNAALQERLKAAKEYGFLSDDGAGTTVVPGTTTPTTTIAPPNPVPGSPGAPAAIDSRYVSADDFRKMIADTPRMLGNLTKMSNEHFSLFGSSLLDVDELIEQAIKTKKNVADVWKEKYKVDDKRKEIETKRQADHDREIGEAAVRKYASEHGQPFTRPGITSVASRFVPDSKADVRQPWKGARERKQERHAQMLDAWNKTGDTGSTRTQ